MEAQELFHISTKKPTFLHVMNIPELDPGEEHEIIFHFDFTASKESHVVYEYLDNPNMKYTRKKQC
jgi:hypothetical protein